MLVFETELDVKQTVNTILLQVDSRASPRFNFLLFPKTFFISISQEQWV